MGRVVRKTFRTGGIHYGKIIKFESNKYLIEYEVLRVAHHMRTAHRSVEKAKRD